MNEFSNNYHKLPAKNDNSKKLLIIAILAYAILVFQPFVPYIAYPTMIGFANLHPIDVLKNISYDTHYVSNMYDIAVFLFLATLVFFIIATKFIFNVGKSYKKNIKTLAINTRKLVSLAGWVSICYFVSSVYLVELCNMWLITGYLRVEGSFLTAIPFIFIKIAFSKNAKLLKKENGDDYLDYPKNWNARIAFIIILTIVAEFVPLIASVSNSGMSSLLFIIMIVIFITCIVMVTILNNDKEKQLKKAGTANNAKTTKEYYTLKNPDDYIWSSQRLIQSNQHVGISKKISLLEYAQALHSKINCLGISITLEEVKNLVSAMVSTKVVLLKLNNPLLSRKFAQVLCECFSSELFIEDYEKKLEGKHENLSLIEETNRKYGVESGFYTGYYMNNFVRPVFFECFDSEPSHKAECYCKAVAGADEKLNFGNLTYLEDNDEYANGKMLLAENVWAIGFINEQNLAYFVKEDWVNYATIVDLKIAEKETSSNYSNFEMLYGPFIQEVEEAQETFYFNDGNWAKIDKLSEYLISSAGITLSNRFLRQIEKFVAAYLSMGGSQEEAMDAVLAMKILPWLASKKSVLVSETVGDFALAIDEIFGNQDIPQTKNALIRFGLKK